MMKTVFSVIGMLSAAALIAVAPSKSAAQGGFEYIEAGVSSHLNRLPHVPGELTSGGAAMDSVSRSQVVIPDTLQSRQTFTEWMLEFRAVEVAYGVSLELPLKFYQYMREQMVETKALSDSWNKEHKSGYDGLVTAGNFLVSYGVEMGLLAAYLKYQGVPTAKILAQVVPAQRAVGMSMLQSTKAKFFEVIKQMGGKLGVSSKVVTTATLGVIGIAEVNGLIAVTMTQAQYEKTLAKYDAIIAMLKAKQAAIADKSTLFFEPSVPAAKK